MFLWFEDMKKDQRKVIEDLSTFLKHPLTTSQTDSLVDHLKFENMKANPNANPMTGMEIESAGNFFRKGEVSLFSVKTKNKLFVFKIPNKEAACFRNSSGIESFQGDPFVLKCAFALAFYYRKMLFCSISLLCLNPTISGWELEEVFHGGESGRVGELD